MQLGMIGLGRMGANMVRRLLAGGHQCVVFDRSPKAVEELARANAVGAASIAELVKKLRQAAGGLADGAGGGGGRDHRRAAAASRRPATSSSTAATPTTSTTSGGHGSLPQGHPLRGRRNQRRRVGARARLLPDDRRRAVGREAARADLRAARARRRRHCAHPGTRGHRRHRRARAISTAGRTAPATS